MDRLLQPKFAWPFVLVCFVSAFLIGTRSSGTGGPRSPVQPDDEIVWNTSFDSTIQGPQLVYFTASWCGPCKMLAAESWPDAGVADAMKAYTAVKIDVDEQPGVAQLFSVAAMPTMAVYHDGAIIAARTGYMPSADVEDFLRESLPDEN